MCNLMMPLGRRWTRWIWSVEWFWLVAWTTMFVFMRCINQSFWSLVIDLALEFTGWDFPIRQSVEMYYTLLPVRVVQVWTRPASWPSTVCGWRSVSDCLSDRLCLSVCVCVVQVWTRPASWPATVCGWRSSCRTWRSRAARSAPNSSCTGSPADDWPIPSKVGHGGGGGEEGSAANRQPKNLLYQGGQTRSLRSTNKMRQENANTKLVFGISVPIFWVFSWYSIGIGSDLLKIWLNIGIFPQNKIGLGLCFLWLSFHWPISLILVSHFPENDMSRGGFPAESESGIRRGGHGEGQEAAYDETRAGAGTRPTKGRWCCHCGLHKTSDVLPVKRGGFPIALNNT